MIHNSILLFIPLAGIICAILIAIMIMKPLALLAYLRAVQAAHEHDHRLYIPLVVLEQDTHHMILGASGAGKTMLLRMYQYAAAQNRRAMVRGRDKLPVYVPLKQYSLFLKMRRQITLPADMPDDAWEQPSGPAELAKNITLIDFLCESDLPGMRYLRRYLKKLVVQGRIVFLCDSLDEVDYHYRGVVCAELEYLLRRTANRLIITSRAVDYRTQPHLTRLVADGQLLCTELEPLQPEQIRVFIERYISEQSGRWQHTAGQIMQVINRSRLRCHCSNPMMLSTLMQIIDGLGVQRGKQIDTRGQLLRTYVSQVIERERGQARWGGEAPAESAVLAFLGELACAARLADDRDAIKLRVSPAEGKVTKAPQGEELAGAVQMWLDEHPPQGPFATDVDGGGKFVVSRGASLPAPSLPPLPAPSLPPLPAPSPPPSKLAQFAQSVGLIDVNADGVLSFDHELIATYLVAAYFSTMDSGQQSAWREELLTDAARWSEVFAIWAGLLDDPLLLAEQLIIWGRANPAYVLETLSLSLVCIGVFWAPPHPQQAERQSPIVLPSSIKEALAEAVRDTETREKLARIFTSCAEEGAQEIYHSLLPLLAVEGVDSFLVLLGEEIVPDMLFSQLVAVVDDAAYEAQVKRLIRVLGRFGDAAVARAAAWSPPEPGRSMRLRAAMVNILGGTNQQSAVAPLIARLDDPETFIRGRAINALFRFGPQYTLSHLIQELGQPAQARDARQLIHWAVLMILERFLDEQDARRRITSAQRQRILEAILSVLTTHYAPETQQQAMEILLRQAGVEAKRSDSGGEAQSGVGARFIAPAEGEDQSGVGARFIAPVEGEDQSGVGARFVAPVEGEDQSGVGARFVAPAGRGGANANSIEAVELLIRNLASEDEEIRHSVVRALQMIGSIATPLLLAQLAQQPSEMVRVHIVEVFAGMHVLDQRVVPHLLLLLADSAPSVQEQAANALYIYAPGSIPGLIELVLFDTNEAVATRAAQALSDIGSPPTYRGEFLVSVMQALPNIVPGRTRLLVQVLEHVHDPQAIPALIDLLQMPDIESLLAVAIIHALSQFADARVVPPLIAILGRGQAVHVYEEAVNALGYLGEVALPGLIAALDIEQETEVTPRVRRALLCMDPFPAEQLIDALAIASEAQAEQIVAVLLAKGSEAAQVLVTQLAHPDERVQGYVRHTLTSMEGHVVVPALLEVLHRPALHPAVDELLHMYPQEAVPQLVGLLGDPERGDAAAAILLEIGPEILPLLVPGLDDESSAAQQRAQRIIVDLVHRSPDVLPQVVRLFSVSLPQRARENLVGVLTNELADVSIPALLAGLENAYLIAGVSEAFVRLVQKHDAQSESALQGLFAALRIEERQRGAKIVLANAGVAAVPGLISLIADPDQSLAQAARGILRDIGVAAFPAIWAASSDGSNRARREAALSTFRSMPTVEIKDGLIEHLLADPAGAINRAPTHISMALGLLLERISDEATLPRTDQEMVRALLEYVQTRSEERATQRIIALLLLIGGNDVANQIAWGLYHYHDQPGHQEQLTRAFLLLGKEAQEVLVGMLRYRAASAKLLAEIVGVLGMMVPHQDVYEYAKAISTPGVSVYQTGMTYAERQAVALRALGGLLAGGHLNSATLQSRQASSLYGSPEHELYSVLLGKPYGPLITKLENELRSSQYEYEKDRREFVIQLSLMQRERLELEEENRQLDAQNQHLEEANRRLEQMLRGAPGTGTR